MIPTLANTETIHRFPSRGIGVGSALGESKLSTRNERAASTSDPMLTTINHPPLTASELQTLEGWSPENLSYLRNRAANHGLSPEELLAEFPVEHRSEDFVSAVLPDLQISHLIPQTMNAELADAPRNIVLELKSQLGGINQSRGDRPMGIDEAHDVHAQTEVFLDARAAELDGLDPLAFDSELPAVRVPDLSPDELREQLEAAFSAAGWQEGLSNMSNHVLQFLADMGVPVAAVLARGASSVWPFLRSINWRRFLSDWRYCLSTLSRAMKVWREGGWKEACRSLVLGIMIAMVPGLSTFVAALGLTGLGALGVRWLANRTFMQNTPLAVVLGQVADVLQACQRFLAGVFKLVEKVVDVVVDVATKSVKHVVAGVAAGAQQVLAVCSAIARSAVQVTCSATRSVGRIANGIFGWVRGWFHSPSFAW